MESNVFGVASSGRRKLDYSTTYTSKPAYTQGALLHTEKTLVSVCVN